MTIFEDADATLLPGFQRKLLEIDGNTIVMWNSAFST